MSGATSAMKSACVFSIDDAYVMPFQVFFHSLQTTKSIPTGTPIFILHTASLSSHSIQGVETFLFRYGRRATFLDASHIIPADLPIRPGDHVSPATFYRLFIAEILPPEIDQAVYLDADMLALRSIADLFELQVQALVAAADQCNPCEGIRLWGERNGTYFNAGVLVIPVKIWRQQGLLQQFLHILATERQRIIWHDQDILNITLADNWQRLPVWYNVDVAVVYALPGPMVEEHAALIHFSGKKKPWNALNPSPFTNNWDLAYEGLFGQRFDRRPFLPPLRLRLKAAIRSRLRGIVHSIL